MKRIYLVFSLLMISVIGFAQSSTNSVIEVVGTAHEEIEPDYALLRLQIRNSAPKAAAVQAELAEVSQRIMQLLKAKEGVSELRTESISLNAEYDYQSKTVKQFRGHQNISFKLRDLAIYDQLIVELFENGLNGINSVQFGHSRADQIQEELLAAAVIDARRRANKMAKAADRELGEALHISDRIEGGSGPRPYADAAYLKSSSAAGGSSIAPGKVRLEVEAYVRFELK